MDSSLKQRSMHGRIVWALLAALLACANPQARVRVVFLPFDDRVKLTEAWDLSVDIPRWFSQTVDTIGGRDSAVVAVGFDAVLDFLKERSWGREEFLAPKVLMLTGSRFDADYLISGTVSVFKIVRRSASSDVAFEGAHDLGSLGGGGMGGARVYGGLESQKAEVRMNVDIYSARTGGVVRQVAMDTERREGDLKVWLPFQTENTALDFYNMRNAPFGSVYFVRCVPGLVMKTFSGELRDRLPALGPETAVEDSVDRRFVEGKILDRVGTEVYLSLGTRDNIIRGEVLRVLRPVRPVTGETGDTLGWVEELAGKVEVRYLKSDHFSVGVVVVEEADSIVPGWSVRTVAPGLGDE